MAQALHDSHARRLYVCNVANMRGETLGLDAADHVEALCEHGLDGAIDVVLAHRCDTDARVCADDVDPVRFDDAIAERIAASGPQVFAADLADPSDPVRHSRDALLSALREVLS